MSDTVKNNTENLKKETFKYYFEEMHKELEKATYAMIGLGVGEVIGGLGNGQLQDKFGYKIALKANLIQLVLAFAMVIYYTIQESWSMYIAVALNFCWGL